MKQALMVMAAAAVLVATGLVHGIRTERWAKSVSVQTASARLDKIPAQIGDWHGRDIKMGERELEIGQIAGYVSRAYTHKPTGTEIQLLVVCGRPGNIGSHTPDVCYGSAGFTFGGAPVVRDVRTTAGDAQLFEVVASRAEPNASHLQLMWGWSTDGRWKAPNRNPRWVYFYEPALYKIYIVRQLPSPQLPEPKDDPYMTLFLETLLPKIQGALKPS